MHDPRKIVNRARRRAGGTPAAQDPKGDRGCAAIMVRRAWGVLVLLAVAGCQSGRGGGDAPALIPAQQLHGTIKGAAIVYLTDAQWQLATSGMTEITTLPRERVQMEAAPMPGGGFNLRPVRCPPGCTPIMRYERRQVRGGDVGSTPLPDEVWIPQCDCPPTEPQVALPVFAQPPPACRIILRRVTEGKIGHGTLIIQCEPVNCGGTCHLVWRRLPTGVMQMGCECR